MKYAFNIILFVLMGAVLGSAGIHPVTWQYWAVEACVVGIALNAGLW